MQGFSIKDLPELSVLDEKTVILVGVPTTNSSGATIQKNYKIRATSLKNNSNNNFDFIDANNFKDINFNGLLCPGIYSSWTRSSTDEGIFNNTIYGGIIFGINLPYHIETDLTDKLYLKNLSIRVRSSLGTTVLIHGCNNQSVPTSYTDISSTALSVVENSVLSSTCTSAISDKLINNPQSYILIRQPNQISINIPVYNNLRYMLRSPSTNPGVPSSSTAPSSQLLCDDAILIVTASGAIGMRQDVI